MWSLLCSGGDADSGEIMDMLREDGVDKWLRAQALWGPLCKDEIINIPQMRKQRLREGVL